MTIITRGVSFYSCDIDEEDSQLILDFAKENNLSLEDAVREIFEQVSVYGHYKETEFLHTDIIEVIEED